MVHGEKCRSFACVLVATSVAVTMFAGTGFAQDNDSAVQNAVPVMRKFDFSAPALNLEGTLSQNATVETVPMSPTEPGTIGNVKVIGKITSDSSSPKIETTFIGYNLQAPSAAFRICTYQADTAGYTTRVSKVASDLTEAMLLGTKDQSGEPHSALISYCFSRGKQALGINFVADVSNAADADAAYDLVVRADKYAVAFIDSLSWENGEESSFGEELQSVPVRIGNERIALRIPDQWEIPINDFHGALPAELHMIRRNGGRDVGLIWLLVQDMNEKPDLEMAGATIVRDYFVRQTPDARPPALISSEEDSLLAKQGIPARFFRFSVTDKKGQDSGDIDATVIWRNGRLHVLTLWSAWPSAADNSNFFSRLPALTVYDIVRQAMVTTQQ